MISLTLGAIAGIVGKAILSAAVGLGATWTLKNIFEGEAGKNFINGINNILNGEKNEKTEVNEKTEEKTENNPNITDKIETPNQDIPNTTDKNEVETPSQDIPNITDKNEVETPSQQESIITPSMSVPENAGTLTPGIGLEQINTNPIFNPGAGATFNPGTGIIQYPDTANKTPNNQTNNEINAMPNTQDKTEENKNQTIPNGSVSEFQKWFEEQKKWREDQQKHLEERQDSAYQRAVADMRKAGINPNLLGSITPADSDAGITTGMNASSSELITMLTTYSNELQQFINNKFKEDENAKDRFTQIFGKFTQGLTLLLFKGLL